MTTEYDQIDKMLGSMIASPEKFCYHDRKARQINPSSVFSRLVLGTLPAANSFSALCRLPGAGCQLKG